MDAIAKIAFLMCFIFLPTLLIFWMLKPSAAHIVKTWPTPTRGKIVRWWGAAWGVFFVVMLVTMTTEEKTESVAAPAPKVAQQKQVVVSKPVVKPQLPPDPNTPVEITRKLQNLWDEIQQVAISDDKEVVRIYIKATNGFSLEGGFDIDTLHIYELLKRMRVEMPKFPAKTFEVNFSATLIDKYGNQSVETIMIIPFNYTEIKKINFEHFPLSNLALFADTPYEVMHAGAEVLTAWCNDSDRTRQERASRLCNF